MKRIIRLTPAVLMLTAAAALLLEASAASASILSAGVPDPTFDGSGSSAGADMMFWLKADAGLFDATVGGSPLGRSIDLRPQRHKHRRHSAHLDHERPQQPAGRCVQPERPHADWADVHWASDGVLRLSGHGHYQLGYAAGYNL